MKLRTALFVVAALLVCRPASAEPEPSIIFDTTVLVMHIDIETATDDAITDAFRAIVPLLNADVKRMRDDLIAKRNELAELGVTSLTTTINFMADGGAPMAAARAADDADMEKIAAWLKTNGPSTAMETEIGDGMVIGWQANNRVPDEPSKAAADRIAAAKQHVGDGAVFITFMPNDQIRQEIIREAQRAQGQDRMAAMMGVTAAKANWIAGVVQVGEAPSAKMMADMPDAPAAEQLKTLWMGVLRMGQQMMMAMASQQGDDMPDLEPVIQAMTPTGNDNQLTVTIDTPAAKTVGRTVLPAIIAARQAAQRTVLMSNMRQATIGVHVYANDYNDQFPANLDALIEGGYIRKDSWQTISKHPDGYSPAFVYVKPDVATMREIEKPSETPLLIEADKDGKPKPNGITAYVDGHVTVPQPE